MLLSFCKLASELPVQVATKWGQNIDATCTSACCDRIWGYFWVPPSPPPSQGVLVTDEPSRTPCHYPNDLATSPEPRSALTSLSRPYQLNRLTQSKAKSHAERWREWSQFIIIFFQLLNTIFNYLPTNTVKFVLENDCFMVFEDGTILLFKGIIWNIH